MNTYVEGITVNGELLLFYEKGVVNCENKRLKSLTVPEGITHLNCSLNPLETLVLPSSLIWLKCEYVTLPELILPAGIKTVLVKHSTFTIPLEIPEGACVER